MGSKQGSIAKQDLQHAFTNICTNQYVISQGMNSNTSTLSVKVLILLETSEQLGILDGAKGLILYLTGWNWANPKQNIPQTASKTYKAVAAKHSARSSHKIANTKKNPNQ